MLDSTQVTQNTDRSKFVSGQKLMGRAHDHYCTHLEKTYCRSAFSVCCGESRLFSSRLNIESVLHIGTSWFIGN